MDSPAGKESSIGDLFGRLADDSKAYVQAEAGLYKAIALRRAGRARNGAIAIVAGALLGFAALLVLLISLAAQLALRVGPLVGGLIVAAGAGIAAFFLFRFGAGRMKALAGDEEEREALLAGERTA